MNARLHVICINFHIKKKHHRCEPLFKVSLRLWVLKAHKTPGITFLKKCLHYTFKTLHISLKSQLEIKAQAIPLRHMQREFQHERGRGTLRPICVRGLLSNNKVRFQENTQLHFLD